MKSTPVHAWNERTQEWEEVTEAHFIAHLTDYLPQHQAAMALFEI